MRILQDRKLDFDDVLIVPKRSKMTSRSEVKMDRRFQMKNADTLWVGIPVIGSNMDNIGTFDMVRSLSSHRMTTALSKNYTEEDLVEFFEENRGYWHSAFYTLGMGYDDFTKLKYVKSLVTDPLKDSFPEMLCIDVANGYQEGFVDYLKKVRALCPRTIIMAGNVVTPEMTEQLILSGADIVKIGVGSGSVCQTRQKTGVGYPQLSAVIECADAAHGLCGHICSDGGCKTPADIVKAFAAGADFVMLGGMFAGVDECDGEWLYEPYLVDPYFYCDSLPDKRAMKFYGMASKEASMRNGKEQQAYRAEEGTCVEVSYKGSVGVVVKEILGGLRSACTYVGAAQLKDLSKCTTFAPIR